MRQLFFKLQPYLTGTVIGVLFGILVGFPPTAVEGLGIWWMAMLAAILVAVQLVTAGAQIAVGLPADPRVERVSELPPTYAAELIERFAALGFEPADLPLRVHLRPTATLWVLRNPAAGCWASVGVTNTLPTRIIYDIFTVFAAPAQGTITTLVNPKGAVLPAPAGHLRQVVPDAAPAEAFARHQEAMSFLAREGVRFEPPEPDDVPGKVRRSLIEQRQACVAHPVRTVLTAVWRSTTGRTPFARPLAEQPGVRAALQLRQQTTTA